MSVLRQQSGGKGGVRSQKLVTAPTGELLTTAETKSHLRVDVTDDDTLIAAMIVAARVAAEAYTRRSFITTVWEYSLDESEIDSDWFELPSAPLQSIVSVTSYDDDNNGTVFGASNYYADTNSEPGRISLVQGSTWPTDLRDRNSLVIRYKAGWGDAVDDIPDQWEEPIKRATLVTVANMYENRGDASLPDTAKALLRHLRVMQL